MKVYFTNSTREFQKYRKNYLLIRNHLVEKGHTLTRDWHPDAVQRLAYGKTKHVDMKNIYGECIQAINNADTVIVEDTVSNFSTGHQITIALQRNKPVLVLQTKEKKKTFGKTFLDAIEHENLEVKTYELANVKKFINRFLRKNENSLARHRFHLVINDAERSYIDWAKQNYDVSRTQIIRKSLQTTMNSDKKYNKYLEKLS